MRDNGEASGMIPLAEHLLNEHEGKIKRMKPKAFSNSTWSNDDEAKLIRLRESEGLSYRGIAREMRRSESSIRAKYSKILKERSSK